MISVLLAIISSLAFIVEKIYISFLSFYFIIRILRYKISIRFFFCFVIVEIVLATNTNYLRKGYVYD